MIANRENKVELRRPWYEELFENFAAAYDRECFTQGTTGEVDFIEREIESRHDARILDLGCGTGRHSVELARRGYTNVTGVDLSEGQLAAARRKAEEAGVSVRFEQADARHLSFHREFDLVLMLCEAAFPLMATDEENFDILKSAAAALAPGGKLICTTLSALYPLTHPGTAQLDPLTFRAAGEMEFTDDSGAKKTIHSDERYYTPSEMSWLLRSAGFRKVEVFGCTLGQYSREKPFSAEDFEMLVVASELQGS